MSEAFTAERFIERLLVLQLDVEREKLIRYFKADKIEGDEFIGV